MTTDVACKPLRGQIVRVRTRHWLVEDVAPSPSGTWLRVSCVEDDAQGEALEVLWETELDGQVLDAEAWAKIGQKGFDDTRHFATYFKALRWHCITTPVPKSDGRSCQTLRHGRIIVDGRRVVKKT